MNEHENIKAWILGEVAKYNAALPDSPVSLEQHKCFLRGYYFGFCHAKGIDSDLDFVNLI